MIILLGLQIIKVANQLLNGTSVTDIGLPSLPLPVFDTFMPNYKTTLRPIDSRENYLNQSYLGTKLHSNNNLKDFSKRNGFMQTLTQSNQSIPFESQRRVYSNYNRDRIVPKPYPYSRDNVNADQSVQLYPNTGPKRSDDKFSSDYIKPNWNQFEDSIDVSLNEPENYLPHHYRIKTNMDNHDHFDNPPNIKTQVQSKPQIKNNRVEVGQRLINHNNNNINNHMMSNEPDDNPDNQDSHEITNNQQNQNNYNNQHNRDNQNDQNNYNNQDIPDNDYNQYIEDNHKNQDIEETPNNHDNHTHYDSHDNHDSQYNQDNYSNHDRHHNHDHNHDQSHDPNHDPNHEPNHDNNENHDNLDNPDNHKNIDNHNNENNDNNSNDDNNEPDVNEPDYPPDFNDSDDIDEDDKEDKEDDSEKEDVDPDSHKYREDLVPECAFGHSYCHFDDEYPEASMRKAVDKQMDILTQILPESTETFDLVEGVPKEIDENYTYIDSPNDLYNSESSEQYSYKNGNQLSYKDGGYICPSYVNYIKPKRAQNNDGSWKVVLNLKESYRGVEYNQHIRIEECVYEKAKCSFAPNYYKSECVQKYSNERLLAWTPDKGIHLDVFRLPIACSCHITPNSD